MVDLKRKSLVKPGLETRFHIDFDWWRQHDRDWRIYLLNFLCPEHQEVFAHLDTSGEVDWVDPETAEVQRVDGLQHVLITHCSQLPAFITQQTTLVDSVFRLFLSNGNTPLNSIELGEQLNRDSRTILRTISGVRVYKGLRPCLDT